MKLRLFAAAATALAFAAGAANATVMTATFTGTVVYSDDYTAEFGVHGYAGDTYTGMTATSVYTFDTAVPGHNSGSNYEQVYGGTQYALANPILSAIFTLNGISQTVDPGLYGSAMTLQAYGNIPPFGSLNIQQNSIFDVDSPTQVFRSMMDQVVSVTGMARLNYNQSGTASPDYPGSSFGQFFDAAQNGGNVLRSTFIQYNIESFSLTGGVEPPSPTTVPEPATWGLMLMGFGGLGAALRRRRAGLALA